MPKKPLNRIKRKSKNKIYKQNLSRKLNSWSVDDATDYEDTHLSRDDSGNEMAIFNYEDETEDETDSQKETKLPFVGNAKEQSVSGDSDNLNDETMTDLDCNPNEEITSTCEEETNLHDRANEIVTSVSLDNEHEENDSDAVNVGLINVPKIFEDNPYSQDVMRRYDGTKALSKRDRTAIADAIVIFALHNNIHLSAKMMSEISIKICRIFPQETPATYFKITAGNNKSGKLYSRYYYQRRLYNRAIEENQVNKEELSDDISTDVVSEEIANSINILKEDGKTVDCYIANWEKTFHYRMHQIQNYETLDDFLNVWPIIGTPLGPSLIDLDFQQLHGVKTITTWKWNEFFNKNWFYFTKTIKNPNGITCCKKVAGITDAISKDAALSFVLHYMLPPALCSRLKNGEKRSRKAPKGRKPSIPDSRNTMLKFVKNDDIDSVIANRRIQFASDNIQPHPYIIGVGESKYKINHFYVVIGDTKVKVSDFITALDCCLKMFIMFQIPYPPESRAVWIVLNKVFFDINVAPVMTARLCAFYNDISK